MQTQVITKVEDLRPHVDAWDELSIARSLPFSAPGVLIPWFELVAPPTAELATIVVHSNKDLVGIAPFFINRNRRGIRYCRPLGTGTFGEYEPLVRPDVFESVATAITEQLADLRSHPASIRIGGLADDSCWIEAICRAWPGRRGLLRRLERTALRPKMQMGGMSFDEWFTSKSSNFRADMRRKQRKLSEAGGEIVLATSSDAAKSALNRFFELHHSRWESRGGSGVINGQVEKMLLRISSQLDVPSRLRIWQMRVHDETIASAIFMEAGSAIGFWLIAHDDEYSRLSPGILLLLAEVTYSIERGDLALSLGTGDQDYKLRFSDDVDTYQWWELIDRRLRLPRTPAELLPTSARRYMGKFAK